MAECRRLLLGLTGATGMLYVPHLLHLLEMAQVEVHAIISDAGRKVLKFELDLKPEDLSQVQRWFQADDFTAAPASGSASYDAMVVLPCTMGTLAAIAGGFCGNLIHRAADVTLKERRPLILGARETPLNRTHLRNMLTVHEAGAVICPPMPAFYQHPQTLDDIARQFAARICDLLSIPVASSSIKRWQGM
jgi:4-hydroxy-3-polyprenylbenzoate decarboxylase